MTDSSGARGRAGRVLVVCTGNVCRSPYIERRLAQLLHGTGIEVSSGGTGALVGSPIDPGSVAQLRQRDAETEGFKARQLTAEMIAHSDLVLTATRAHRAEVVRLSPRAMARCFTLADFAHLVADASADEMDELDETDPGASWVARVAALAASRRGLVPPLPLSESDIPDPYRQGPEAFAVMADAVENLLPAVEQALTP
ncbi:low molecular weight phosphatase family protein [Terrabacter lapilli]|uniref:Low molecular weight phosphatase family protein n=1 Tax=Terrabacter lapilli TaxID=436231 RepID=A0ABP5CMF3_9MICO